MALSYSLCETVGVDREDIRMLEVNRGGSVAEEEHEEVDSLRVVVEVAGYKSQYSVCGYREEGHSTYSQNMVWSGRPVWGFFFVA